MPGWKTWTASVLAIQLFLIAQSASAMPEETSFQDTARLRVNLVKVMQLADELQATPRVRNSAVGSLVAEVASEWTKYRASFQNFPTLEIGYVFSQTGGMYYGVMPWEFVQAVEEMDVLVSDQPGRTTLDGEPAELIKHYLAANLESESDDGSEPLASDVRIFLRQQANKVAESSESSLFEASFIPSGFLRNRDISLYFKQTEAYVLTDAQERDGESVGTFAYRKFRNHILSSLLRIVTKEITELHLGARRLDGGYCTELIVDAKENSSLKSYFGRLKNVRNRSVAWLHPDHDSFFSVCLPLPDMVTERLTQLSSANQDLARVAGMPRSLTDALTRWEEELAESKQIEWLHQSIPGEHGNTKVVVLPGRNTFQLTESAIQLVSSEDTNEFLQPYATTVSNYAVHEVTEAATWAGTFLPGLSLLGEGDVAYVIPTSECLLLVAGPPNDCLDIAQELIERDFEPCPQAAKFARTAIGGEFSAATSHSMLLALTQKEPVVAAQTGETPTSQTADDPVNVSQQASQQGAVENSEHESSPRVQRKPRVMLSRTPSQEADVAPVPGFRITLHVEDARINLRTTFPKGGEAVMITFVSRLLTGLEVIADFLS